MRRAKKLKPVLTLLLAAVMLLGIFPGLPAMTASAYVDIVSKPTVCCRVKVADIWEGGTNSDIYLKIYYVDNTEDKKWMDVGGNSVNDFGRDSDYTYSFTIDKPVWMIKKFGVLHDGSDAITVTNLDIYVKAGNNKLCGLYNEYTSGDGYEFEDTEVEYTIDQTSASQSTMRWIRDESYNTFMSVFDGKTVYLDSSAGQSAQTVKWTPSCDRDGFFKPYNPYSYADAPDLTYTMQAFRPGDTGWSDVTIKGVFDYDTSLGYKDGFTYTPATLYGEMLSANYYGVKLKLTLSYPTRSSRLVTSKTAEYTFLRTEFTVGDPQIVSPSFQADIGNYYFNSSPDYDEVGVFLPVQANLNYNMQEIAANLSLPSGTGDSAPVKLYYGSGSNDFLEASNITYNGNGFFFIFDTTKKSYNRPAGGSDGFKLLLKDVKSGVSTGSGTVYYKLFDAGSFEGQLSSQQARTVNLGGRNVSLGIGAYYRSLDEYKLDNVPPVIQLWEDGAGSSGVTGQWQKKITLYHQAAETLYLKDVSDPVTAGGWVTVSVTDGTRELRVYVDDESTKKAQFNIHSMVGDSTRFSFNLPGEEIDTVTVTATARDFAGNEATTTLQNLKLDNLAPRVGLLEGSTSNQDADGYRVKEYAFNIEDKSETGLVYYCFVRDGEQLPSETAGKEHSGVITDLIGQWAFVSQTGESRTVILKLANGESFKGKLYYYSVDALGNRSATNSVDIEVYNQEAGCDYAVYEGGSETAYTGEYPLSEYNIVFTPKPNCEVYWRYASQSATYTKYSPGGKNPGDPLIGWGSEKLNGQQILEYKVVNTLSGNEVEFTGNNGIILTFDNEDPQLTLTRTSSGKSLAAQTFTLAARDASGIASARYDVLAAGEDSVVTSGDLSIEAGTGVLQASLSTADISGLGNGAYRLRLTATDRNGSTASTVGDVFSIRVQAPQVQVTAVNGAAPGNPTLTGSIDYTLGLSVSDAFLYAAEDQNAYIRVSADGSTYSDWLLLSALTQGTDAFTASVTVDTSKLPALSEGMNTVYLQVICAEKSKNLTSESISAPSVFTLAQPVSIQLDLTAPTLSWSATCTRNNTALTGNILVSDGVTAYPTVTCLTTGVLLTRDSGNGNLYRLVYEVSAEEPVPDEIHLLAEDEAGNQASLTVVDQLTLLDLTGPALDFDAETLTYGDRVDARITVTVTEEHPGDVSFRFSDEENMRKFSTVTDNGDGTYTVLLRGFNSSGVSPFTVDATDDLGNLTSESAPAVTVAYPELRLESLFAEPAYARESTPVGLQFNIPAVAAPIFAVQNEGETLADVAERAFREAEDQLNQRLNTASLSTVTSCVMHASVYSVTADTVAYALESKFGSGWRSELEEIGTGEWSCYIMARDEFGNTKYYVVYPNTRFEMEFPIDFVIQQYYGGSAIDTFPGNAIVVGSHVSDPSADPNGTTAEYTATVVVRAYNLRDADGNFYLRRNAAGGGYVYLTQDGRTLTADEFAAEAKEPKELDYALFPYTILTAGDERIADPANPGAEDHDGKTGLFRFNRSSADTRELAAGDYGWAFSQLAFDAADATGANTASSILSVGYVNHPGKAAGGEPQTVYIRVIPDSGAGSAAEAALDPADIWFNETLQLGSVFAAQPQITYTWVQSTIAAEVALNASASGSGTSITVLKLLRWTGDSWTAVEEWTGGDGPNLSVTIAEEGSYCIYAENEYGLSSLTPAFDITIETTPITEDDFTITTEVDDYGWVTVTDQNTPTPEARFTVTINDSGKARGLAVTDPVSGVVSLTWDAPSYNLVLQDNYGYRYEKLLTYENLIEPPKPDLMPPTAAFRFTNENKTNRPYEVLITPTDEESGIRSVSLSFSGEDIALTEAEGVWTGAVSANGSYMITVEDKAGNVTKQTFSVLNIDNTPVTAELEWSNKDYTQDMVTVSMSFNKHNVTVTKMERTSGHASLDKDAARLSFPDNGTVSVWYVDEYGNEGVSVVTVTNIYDKPPQLKAIPELAADGMSVSVTFAMETDAGGAPLDFFRKLNDLTVIYNGVSFAADEARYILRENGTYTFTVVDQVGLMQVIKVELKDIDRDAPQVKSVSWTYTYLDEDGNEKYADYSLGDIEGEGYRIAIDRYFRTNRDVTVTVTTDAPTTIMGSYDTTARAEHSLIYRENGMYIYNLRKANGLSVSYGVDVEIIDKTPPEIALEGPAYLLYVEGRDTGSIREQLSDYRAWDEYLGRVTDLTAAVRVDFGGLDPDVLENNTFDKSLPYTVTYSVKDDAGNEFAVTRTVVLVSMNDVLVTVNGVLPNAASMVEAKGDLELKLINFSGTAFASYASGMRTFGQMKTVGKVIRQEDGAFRITGLKEGWYTFFVQTETRDYFNIYVFVG